jgi:ArsR family transcriptional regulator
MADTTTPTNTASTTTDACCGGSTDWLDRAQADALATRLAAVADPIRLQVLSIIANAPAGEVCACDFVEPLGRSQPTISHHLKVLTEAGLVEGDKRGRWIWYRLAGGALDNLVGSLGAVAGPIGAAR